MGEHKTKMKLQINRLKKNMTKKNRILIFESNSVNNNNKLDWREDPKILKNKEKIERNL